MDDITEIASIQLNTEKIKWGNPWDNIQMSEARIFAKHAYWMERVIAN